MLPIVSALSTWTRVWAVAGAALALTCHRAPTAPSLPATLSFEFPPINPAFIAQITSLGNVNPPAHTLPTNHIYLYHAAVSVVVTAPAGGRITEARRQSTDDAIYIQATSRTTYHFAHLVLDAGITTGGTVTAGQRLGVTPAVAGGLDLGVSNEDVTLFFVRPDRYISATIHADSPLKYFTEPTRGTLYAKVRRSGDEKDGKINYDQAGRLAGNWFLEGLPVLDTEAFENGPKHLSFAQDVFRPSLAVVSIGGHLTSADVFYLGDSAPDPSSVSTGSGRVVYELFDNALRTGTGTRWLVVQLIADDRIRIEVFPPGTPAPADFAGAALIYTR